MMIGLSYSEFLIQIIPLLFMYSIAITSKLNSSLIIFFNSFFLHSISEDFFSASKLYYSLITFTLIANFDYQDRKFKLVTTKMLETVDWTY